MQRKKPLICIHRRPSKNMPDYPIWTVHVWLLSWFYLNIIKILYVQNYFGQFQNILDQTQNDFSQLMFAFRTMSKKLVQSTRKTSRTFLLGPLHFLLSRFLQDFMLILPKFYLDKTKMNQIFANIWMKPFILILITSWFHADNWQKGEF